MSSMKEDGQQAVKGSPSLASVKPSPGYPRAKAARHDPSAAQPLPCCPEDLVVGVAQRGSLCLAVRLVECLLGIRVDTLVVLSAVRCLSLYAAFYLKATRILQASRRFRRAESKAHASPRSGGGSLSR